MAGSSSPGLFCGLLSGDFGLRLDLDLPSFVAATPTFAASSAPLRSASRASSRSASMAASSIESSMAIASAGSIPCIDVKAVIASCAVDGRVCVCVAGERVFLAGSGACSTGSGNALGCGRALLYFVVSGLTCETDPMVELATAAVSDAMDV